MAVFPKRTASFLGGKMLCMLVLVHIQSDGTRERDITFVLIH